MATGDPTRFSPVSIDAAQHERAFADAVADGRVGDRLWLYATYHCNLACSYCLTESHPGIADRRALAPGSMLRAVEEAAALGFGSVGITGGEVFMLPSFAGDARRGRPHPADRRALQRHALHRPRARRARAARRPRCGDPALARLGRPRGERRLSRCGELRGCRGGDPAAPRARHSRPHRNDRRGRRARRSRARSASCTAASACPTRITSCAGSSAEGGPRASTSVPSSGRTTCSPS